MIDVKSLADFSKETVAPAARKRYTAPALKIYGAVSELTNGGGTSIADHATTKQPNY